MPLVWVGVTMYFKLCLQCLSAGGALMPTAATNTEIFPTQSPMPFGWGALMPKCKAADKCKGNYLVSNAFRLGGL